MVNDPILAHLERHVVPLAQLTRLVARLRAICEYHNHALAGLAGAVARAAGLVERDGPDPDADGTEAPRS